MTKNTMANKLPRKLIQKMEIVGEQIKLARLRRNLSMAQPEHGASCKKGNMLGSYTLQGRKGITNGFHRNLPSCTLCSSAG